MQTFSADASDALIDGGSEDTSSGLGDQLPRSGSRRRGRATHRDFLKPVWVPTPEDFALFDFQPQSCGFQATYGLSLYENHVTMVALLAAW